MSEARKSRLPIWLIVSLLANALLIGLLIGGGLGQRKAGPPAGLPGGEEALIRGIDRSVPEDQRRAVRQTFRRAFEDSRSERVAVREARQHLVQVLAADPYDPAAVQAGFADLRNAEARMKSRMQDVLAQQFGALTAEQRRAVMQDVNRRDRRQGRGQGRGRGGNDRPPPPRGPRDRD